MANFKVGDLVHLTSDALENIFSDMDLDLDAGLMTRKRWSKIADAIELHVKKRKPFEITTASQDGFTVKAGEVTIDYCLPETDLEAA